MAKNRQKCGGQSKRWLRTDRNVGDSRKDGQEQTERWGTVEKMAKNRQKCGGQSKRWPRTDINVGDSRKDG